MRGYWKLLVAVAIASALQWLVSHDINWFDDAQLTARIALVRFAGGRGDEPGIERAAHALVQRQWQRQLRALPPDQRAWVEAYCDDAPPRADGVTDVGGEAVALADVRGNSR